MNFRNFLRTLAVACTFAFATTASATAILQVNSAGILTGATGVTVGGKVYDVTFADGTCIALFNGCVQSAFTFSTAADAMLAADALLSQVFIDGPSGNFDSTTSRIFGCTSSIVCYTFIPFARDTGSSFTFGYSLNYPLIPDGVSRTGVSIAFDAARDYPTVNFALFTLGVPAAANVPEPSSVALMGLALAGLAFIRRRNAS